jgi:hypothetical protein
VVAGAAAEVALEPVPDLLVGGVRIAREQVGGGHDHAGRTEAALEAVLLPEGGLHRVQFAVTVREALDGRDLRAVGLRGEHGAALHRLSVHVNRARAAVRGVAAHVSTGKPELVAQPVDEQESRLHVLLPLLTVDGDLDVHARAHQTPSGRGSLLRCATDATATIVAGNGD